MSGGQSEHGPLRVLFLTRYPVEGASSRYRVFQYLPHLARLGIEAEVSSFMDDEFYRLSFSPGRRLAKAWRTTLAVWRRLRALARHRRYDLIVMQRELFPFGPAWAERWLRRRGARLIFDYDDALFISKPSRYNPLATWLRAPTKTFDIMALSDRVLAGNDYLRDMARPYCPGAVTFQVAEDTDRIGPRPPHANGDAIVIGWLGSTSTSKYLRLIAGALRRVQAQFPFVVLEVVGGGEIALPGIKVRRVAWSLDEELEALRRFDIGIMPLPLEEWSKGKSGGKARTYMAAGIPPVCTRIGYNIELVGHGVTGLLCTTEEEWVAALSALVQDPALRQRLGEAARRDVMERFALPRQAERLAAILADVAALPRPPARALRYAA